MDERAAELTRDETYYHRGRREDVVYLRADEADPSGATVWVRTSDDDEVMVSRHLLEPHRVGQIVEHQFPGCRHSAEVDSDRLSEAVRQWGDRFSPEELNMVGVIRQRLEQIASGEQA